MCQGEDVLVPCGQPAKISTVAFPGSGGDPGEQGEGAVCGCHVGTVEVAENLADAALSRREDLIDRDSGPRVQAIRFRGFNPNTQQRSVEVSNATATEDVNRATGSQGRDAACRVRRASLATSGIDGVKMLSEVGCGVVHGVVGADASQGSPRRHPVHGREAHMALPVLM